VIDSHAHIHDKQFDADRDEVVARAKATGVSTLVTVGCDLADSQRALEAANHYGLFASVGVHPHEAIDAPADLGAAFQPFVENPRIVAIGETGLDYFYDHSPRDVQREVLRKQLRIARDRDLPVIFHHRDAYDDFVAILREEFASGMRGVIHCFTGDAEQARTYVDEFGLMLGIGGVVTFKSADTIRHAVQAVGLAPLILETDCPYLAPVPLRGKRNEPAFVTKVADKLVEVLAISRECIIESAERNTRELFRLPS
jgi:TatD DNase family protein